MSRSCLFWSSSVVDCRSRIGPVQPQLQAAKDKGIKVGLLILGKSAIFNAQANKSIAEAEAMFHLIHEIPDAYHIDPNLRPGPVVEVQNRMFDELERLGTVEYYTAEGY